MWQTASLIVFGWSKQSPFFFEFSLAFEFLEFFEGIANDPPFAKKLCSANKQNRPVQVILTTRSRQKRPYYLSEMTRGQCFRMKSLC